MNWGVSKKAQLTLFVLVSVLLVLAIVLYYFFQGDFLNRDIPGSESVQEEILDCLDFTSKNALYFVSYQGGYVSPPEKSFSFSPTFFAYYYYEGQSLMPSLDAIESQMALYVRENLDICLASLSDDDFVVSSDISLVSVQINEEGVEFTVDDAVTIQKESSSMQFDLSSYPQFYNVRLYDMYLMSEFFVNDLIEDEDYYCITCLSRMADISGTKFYLFPVVDDVYLVMVFEDKPNPLVFNFMTKYREEVREVV